MSRLMKVKKVAPASLDEALAQFLNWKKANGISEQTILDYTTHVNLLFKRFPFAKDSYEKLER